MTAPASSIAPLRIVQRSQVAFRSATGLFVRATDDPASPVVDDFYAGYDKAFVLPNEKEDLAGFRECLALNHGAAFERLQGLYGPYREIVAVAVDPDTDQQVAGASLIAFPARPGGDRDTPLLTINLNYVFVTPEARGKGHLRRMAQAVCEMAAAWFVPAAGNSIPEREAVRSLVFIEQNDPLRISEADAAADTLHSGIDQFDRIRIWTKLGARIIDFPYVQPPLSAHQSIDDGLLLSVYGALPERLDACDLGHHLERFFAISVLKGADPMQQQNAAQQLRSLKEACTAGESLALLDPTEALDRAQKSRAEGTDAALGLRSFLIG